jgi:23S rRNA pseudouridine2457 synthase
MLKKRTSSRRKPPPSETQLILLNKPYGVVSQFSGSDHNLSHYIRTDNVYPAGRLDKDSEGLLLLTNNGKLQNRIASPKHKMKKVYLAQVEGVATDEMLQSLMHGVILKDGPARAVSARKIDSPPSLWPRDPPVRFRKCIPTSWIELTLQEGRNRQVRRMTAAVGLPTLRLIRQQIGDWSIDQIESGKYLTIALSTEEAVRLGSG